MKQENIGARVLLKHLRDAMAEPLGPQQRLDRIVQHIASAMQADVCSVYALRADDVLELFATYGLNMAAVHKAQLKIGQGLIGRIARKGRLLNIADAQTHPAFLYQPEVGEDEFHSFLGVPMKRSGRTMGVLVVRRKEHNIWPIEEVEAIETAAMVLSDLMASGDMTGLTATGTGLDTTRAVSKTGMRLAPGIGSGEVRLHDPRVVITRLFNDDVKHEQKRLAIAIQSMRDSFDAMLDNHQFGEQISDAGGEHMDVLESLRMFAHDRGWVRRISKAIEDGLTAEAATEKVAQDNRARLRMAPAYLRERLEDFDDLARRLLRHLIGESGETQTDTQPIVVVAQTISAAELLDYDRERITALVVEQATATSHVIIVARALGIAVVRVKEIVGHCENGDLMIVDGDDGSVHLRPDDGLQNSYNDRILGVAKKVAYYDTLKSLASRTKDEVDIQLLLNGGLDADMQQLEQTGAQGVGLFRTELRFMLSSTLPKLNDQVQFYKGILDLAGDKPVTFRTLDIGGDKLLTYLSHEFENNPAMGWRAIRLSIDRPALLRIQLRALLRAAVGKHLKIKLPMISVVDEIDQARALLNKEIEAQKRFGYELPLSIQMGAMIEVPGILWQLDELMYKVDFVSVGSNDLFQFMTASDRTNSALANRYNPISRHFFRALRQIARAGERHQTPFLLCGELAGEPLSAMALLGIGYRTISMAPGSIGPVKEMVRKLDLREMTRLVNNALDDLEPGQTLYEVLRDYADRKGIVA